MKHEMGYIHLFTAVVQFLMCYVHDIMFSTLLFYYFGCTVMEECFNGHPFYKRKLDPQSRQCATVGKIKVYARGEVGAGNSMSMKGFMVGCPHIPICMVDTLQPIAPIVSKMFGRKGSAQVVKNIKSEYTIQCDQVYVDYEPAEEYPSDMHLGLKCIVADRVLRHVFLSFFYFFFFYFFYFVYLDF